MPNDTSQDSTIIEKNKCPRISKSCSLVESWKSIGHHVASRFGGPEFLPVPYLLEANAYGIGHVFVPVTTEAGCFGSSTRFKLIGAIGKHVVKSSSNPRWYEGNFPAVKSSPEHRMLKVRLGSGNREIVFTASNYYYLSKPDNMVATGDVTIDRSSHEDLTNAKWIGLISEAVASDVFQMEITAKLRGRKFYVGDSGAHTFLFKYDICRLDETGNVCHVSNSVRRDDITAIRREMEEEARQQEDERQQQREAEARQREEARQQQREAEAQQKRDEQAKSEAKKK